MENDDNVVISVQTVKDEGLVFTTDTEIGKAYRGQFLHQESSLIEPCPTFESQSDDDNVHITIKDSSDHLSWDDSEGSVEDIAGACSPSPGPDSPHSPQQTIQNNQNSSFDAVGEEMMMYIYLFVFSCFGSVLRVYMARFFGLDCENKGQSAEVGDFFSPFFSNICITSSGKTNQRGGALFIDLPANMLGCFVIGLLSPPSDGYPFPWLHAKHPLQSNKALQIALKVGFCGSLTTFASWNTQMIVMLDGSYTALGPQVGSAIFGFLIGVATSVACFIFGRTVYDWAKARQKISETLHGNDEEAAKTSYTVEEDYREPTGFRNRCMALLFGVRTFAPLFWCIALFLAFVLGDIVDGLDFYRRMWILCLLSPLGSLARFKLSRFNARDNDALLAWIPKGTLAANLSAAVLHVTLEAIKTKFMSLSSRTNEWTMQLLLAMQSGFAGSLSTVSTLVKEMFDKNMKPAHGYGYCFLTIVSAVLLGLSMYSPIVRYG